MSRIGKRILNVPNGVELTIENSNVTVKGKLGQLSFQFSPLIKITYENNEVKTERLNEEKTTKQLHGTTNALIHNMIIGVSKGYKKEIEIKGVGYKATLMGNKIEIIAGYSHPIQIEIPVGLKAELPKPTKPIFRKRNYVQR